MLFALLFINKLRLQENHDWILFILLGCTVLYLFLIGTLQRDATLKSYLLQDYSETSNIFQSWILIGIINSFLVSALVSQYIPVVPKNFSNLHIFGLELNKFGFALLAVSFFYLLKSAFTYLLFQSLGVGRRWKLFCYSSGKFYFVLNLIVSIIIFAHYFFGLDYKGEFYMIDAASAFPIYISFAALVVIFKNAYYIFNRNEILPFTWYYKILYICTLQIAPVLALWKLLFI